MKPVGVLLVGAKGRMGHAVKPAMQFEKRTLLLRQSIRAMIWRKKSALTT
jgi:hypothetical protein